MKRGHSNVKPEKTAPWVDKYTEKADGIAKIPLCGGATFQTVNELPPLALRESEWRQIGEKMGWIRPKRTKEAKTKTK